MRRWTALATVATSLVLAACAGGDEGPERLTVFAAASLSATFTELAEAFEEEHGVQVDLNLAGSSDLVAQLEQGAPADVFASADEQTMARAVDSDLVEPPVLFASNTLVIVTPPDDPAGIEDLGDLARPEVVTVVCAPQVPCGAATERVTAAAGITLSPASEESAVTDVLGKVIAGEADAGVVYRTDAIGAGEVVRAIEFPEARNAVNHYPIATLRRTGAPAHAELFVDLITGEQGRAALAEAGFGAP